jgi:hypothetical protein
METIPVIKIKYREALTTTGLAATSITLIALFGCTQDAHIASRTLVAGGAIRLDVETTFSGGAAGSTTTTVVARYRENNFSSTRDILKMTGLHGDFCIKDDGKRIDIYYDETRISSFNNFFVHKRQKWRIAGARSSH